MNNYTKKRNLSNLIFRERTKKYRDKINADPIRKEIFKEKKRESEIVKYKTSSKNPKFLKRKQENLQRHRQLKKNSSATVEFPDDRHETGSFKSKSSFSKAMMKVSKALPKDSANQKTIVQELFYKHFPDKKPKSSRVVQPKSDNQIVIDFYNKDDVSQQLAGKKDTRVVRGPDGSKTYVQKRVMIMTLTEAFAYFKESNPECKVAKTKFCSLKPFHVDLVRQMKQIGCLCKKCENMKLLFAALKPLMSEKFNSLEDLVESFSCGGRCNGSACDICCGNSYIVQELFESDESENEISLVQWSQDVFQLRLKTEIKNLSYCINLFIESLIDYKHHIFIKKSQSSLFYEARASSSPEEAIVQVDFAENFKCISQNEIQSAYFNQHAIAIFTVVIWSGEETFSKVYVTDDTSHSKFCVLTFMHELSVDLKEALPTLKKVKMFSDGCAGQFKNRWTLSLVLTASFLFGFDLEWNFFASGHGKGAVDGVGGTVKRTVHQRIMSGLVRVYSAEEFHKCVSENIQGVKSCYVPVEKIKAFEAALGDKWTKIKAIPGVTKFFSFKKHCNTTIEAYEVGSSEENKLYKIMN